MTKKELKKLAKCVKQVAKAIKAAKLAKGQLAEDDARDILSDWAYEAYHYGKSIGL